MDYDDAVAEYHASRARYIRTVTSDAERRLGETIGKRRAALREEIANLTLLAHDRHATYQAALQASKCDPASRKLYQAAVRAADEFREVNDVIRKRKDLLGLVDYKLRVQLEQYARDLIAQLETESGLDFAFQRDPLLARAHARMLAARPPCLC